MTPATELKRKELQAFIERVLKPNKIVEGVVGIGSIATGRMRPNSDIDAVIFMRPLNHYIVPAEFIWLPEEGTYHSIFTDDEKTQRDGIQFDFLRLDWFEWSNPEFFWPEPRRAELHDGWIAFDRDDKVHKLIAKRTAYSEKLRESRLDEALVCLDQHLMDNMPQVNWEHLGPALAHDRLQAAYFYLMRALFAINRRWLPWRNRQASALLRLPWLPEGLEENLGTAVNAPGLDHDAYLARVNLLTELFEQILDKLIVDGDYSAVPVDQAFTRLHDEPGYAWNMDDWNAERLRRLLEEASEKNKLKD